MGDLVSIITPAYNSARFIADTIESVISQTYLDWEMIIVDDCSDDETVSIARKYGDDRIRCISHHSRMGAAAARKHFLTATTCGKPTNWSDKYASWWITTMRFPILLTGRRM